jgi:SAM-dependent methyltransferase
MNEETVQTIVNLNRRFYEQFAASFAETRQNPQPGYEQLLALFSRDRVNRVLDVGCGNGRFGRFLSSRHIPIDYIGVDFSQGLLSYGSEGQGCFIARDLSRPESLAELGLYDVIVCLSTIQHIPGHINRLRLVAEMRDHLQIDGRLVIANWQFLDSPRQRKKIRPWQEVGINPLDVEHNDYVLSWQRGELGLRYVAYINEHTIAELADQAGMTILTQYRSDGREGDLNLYTILAG